MENAATRTADPLAERRARRVRSLRAGVTDLLPILVGVVPFGLVAGAAVIHAGQGLAESLGMSLIVFAGASQIIATALFGDHAPLWVALLTALIVNSRMFIYSTSIATHLSDAPQWQRPFLGYMLVDQNYAAVMTQGRVRDDIDLVPYYVGAWATLWTTWQLSSLAGTLLGPVIPPSWGLDFAVPLVFLAMLAPSLNNRTAVGVAVVTGLSAAVLVPVLPMQSGLIVALLCGMAYGAWRDAVAPAEGAKQ